MHLLLTNDDGVFAPGLHSLARAAIRAGHRVTISAPSTQQSATSHKLTITASMMAMPYPFEGADAYGVEGSPVDCVRVGRYLSDEPIDFCLSGINDGENIGTAIYYSGTAAAAREAAMLNIPSIAVSLGENSTPEMQDNIANIALEVMTRIKDRPLPRLTFVNLNARALPPKELKGLIVCPMSDAFYLDNYVKRVNPRGVPYFWITPEAEMEPYAEGTDVDLFHKGYITCTFVGGFLDNNHLYERLLGGREG